MENFPFKEGMLIKQLLGHLQSYCISDKNKQSAATYTNHLFIYLEIAPKTTNTLIKYEYFRLFDIENNTEVYMSLFPDDFLQYFEAV
jgi:hypothetical protein